MFNILIVDDDINVRAHVRSVCKRAGEGVAIYEAVDSQEALTRLEEHIIQLCIMDLHLPDMLGTDLLKIVKQQYGGIKVIMLSGDSSFDAVRQSFMYKADDYIEKPVDEMSLLQKVREMREKYFLGLKTIELPKKSISEYLSFSLNEDFAALGRDNDDRYVQLRERYDLGFDYTGGAICSFELGGLDEAANTEYYYSYLAERIKRDFSGFNIVFMFFGGRLTAVINSGSLNEDLLRSRFNEIKSIFNENGISMSVFISERFNGKVEFFPAYRTLLDMIRNSDMYGKNEIVVSSGGESNRSQVALVQRAKRYIQDMVYESFSLVNVAEYLGIHPNYLSKIFKQAEGIAFTDYVCDCKMQEAKRLLLETNLKIYAIAEKLHYYDTGYFIRIFKKYYGVSPNQFRQRSE
ncbi:MAG TPA: response regulator [Oscillospiraceae bacterium]|nr:response regulator [Oscillospiraceae bacterium]HPF56184.1 response regulator [Clostridiales bacterium]HPK36477.1 response regulator [Oscillospiraceae bacterium]HPR75775.1 response regulator [Oscillospiraceae bacterium]